MYLTLAIQKERYRADFCWLELVFLCSFWWVAVVAISFDKTERKINQDWIKPKIWNYDTVELLFNFLSVTFQFCNT